MTKKRSKYLQGAARGFPSVILPMNDSLSSANRVYVLRGDITQLAAHAIVLSVANSAYGSGMLHASFEANVPAFKTGFERVKARWARQPVEVGHAEWLPIPNRENVPSQPLGVVVAAATGGGVRADKDGDLQSEWAVRGALECALENLRREIPNGRLVVALPTFRIGSGGSANRRMSAARSQVRTCAQVLAEHPNVDAIFVCYTPEDYQVFIEARRRENVELPAPAIPSALREAIGDGCCVLFIGAGLSRPCGLPDWKQLVGKLAQQLAIPLGNESNDIDEFLDIAQEFRERHDKRLGPLIQRRFACKHNQARPGPAHAWLMSLQSRYIVTTNYDDLLESALEALRVRPTIVREEKDVARASGVGPHVVKMHGDARAPDPQIVLSRDDYDEWFQRHPVMSALLEGLLLNQTFLFLGYSLRDPNFRQIYHRIASMLREAQRPAFAVTFGSGSADSLSQRAWKRRNLHPIAVEDERQLWDLLDALAVQSGGDDRLFLSPDVPQNDETTDPQFVSLRQSLHEVARHVLLAAKSDLSVEEVRQVARVLDFLTEAGWRPRSINRAGIDPRLEARLDLSERVAQKQPALALRILRPALADAGGLSIAALVRKRLDELEKRVADERALNAK